MASYLVRPNCSVDQPGCQQGVVTVNETKISQPGLTLHLFKLPWLPIRETVKSLVLSYNIRVRMFRRLSLGLSRD